MSEEFSYIDGIYRPTYLRLDKNNSSAKIDGNARFTTVPLKPLSDQVRNRYKYFVC